MNAHQDSTSTHPSLAALHDLFEGHAADPATARHARDCPSCAHQMQALTDQRQALGSLLHRDGNWIKAAQRQGRAVLSDLIAELARACLARTESAQRNAPLSELPRTCERITADIHTLITRLSRLATTAASTATATVTHAAAGTLRASGSTVNWPDLERLAQRRETDPDLRKHCLAALRSLEGESPRWRALAASIA